MTCNAYFIVSKCFGSFSLRNFGLLQIIYSLWLWTLSKRIISNLSIPVSWMFILCDFTVLWIIIDIPYVEQFFGQVYGREITVSKLCSVCSRCVSLHLLFSQLPGLPPRFTFVQSVSNVSKWSSLLLRSASMSLSFPWLKPSVALFSKCVPRK